MSHHHCTSGAERLKSGLFDPVIELPQKPFLCAYCYGQGYCKRLRCDLVRNAEIANPDWVHDVRITAVKHGKKPREWPDYLDDLYRDYLGWIADTSGNEIFLNVGILREPNARFFFRDFCRAPEPNAHCFVRPVSWERVRVLATILKAHDPGTAMNWGLRADNDNKPPLR